MTFPGSKPLSARVILVLLPVAVAVGLVACGKHSSAANSAIPKLESTNANAPVVHYSYEVVNAWPHERSAFTQGLVYHGGDLLESTGLNGESTLRQVDLKTGRVLKQISVPILFFAEGLAVLGEKAYQLTWQNHRGFVYNVYTFQKEKEFTYDGEGWGLTTDGHSLVLSDGTSRIRFVDPTSFQVTRTIDVTSEGRPVVRLNELEWIGGEIFANVWQTNLIVRIDPATGHVRGEIDFGGLLSPEDRHPDTDVFNGIAYDAAQDRLFVTGKHWPKLFEVRIKTVGKAANAAP
jgi:glutamine cyclotransferase